MNLKLIKTIALVSASLMATGCSNKSGPVLPEGICLREGTFAKNESVKKGQTVYDLTIYKLDGSEVTFRSLLEQYDAIYLNFTYTSCYWCAYEAPFINEAYDTIIPGTTSKYSEKIAFIGICDPVADSATLEEVQEFVTEEGFQFPFMRDNKNYSRYFPVNGYPSSFLVDRYGYLAEYSSTFTDTSKATSFLDKVLGDDYIPSYCK